MKDVETNHKSTLDQLVEEGKAEEVNDNDKRVIEEINKYMQDVRRKFVVKEIASKIKAAKTFVG